MHVIQWVFETDVIFVQEHIHNKTFCVYLIHDSRSIMYHTLSSMYRPCRLYQPLGLGSPVHESPRTDKYIWWTRGQIWRVTLHSSSRWFLLFRKLSMTGHVTVAGLCESIPPAAAACCSCNRWNKFTNRVHARHRSKFDPWLYLISRAKFPGHLSREPV